MSHLDHRLAASPVAGSRRSGKWLPAIVFALGAVACGSEIPTPEPTPLPPVDCTPSLAASPNPVPSQGGTVQIDVTIASGCTWVASENADWLVDLAPSAGQGSGHFTVRAFQSVLLSGRQGTVTVNGVSLIVVQRGVQIVCADYFRLDPSAAMAPATGATIRVRVSAFEGCSWSTGSEAPWLSVLPYFPGLYGGDVDVAVAPNVGGARTGIVRIAGLAFTVSQSAAGVPPCTYEITPTAQSVSASGGVFVIQVTTGAGCAWSAAPAPSAFWLTGVEPAGGAGNGTVSISVATNTTGAARQGTLTVAGHTLSVIQAP